MIIGLIILIYSKMYDTRKLDNSYYFAFHGPIFFLTYTHCAKTLATGLTKFQYDPVLLGSCRQSLNHSRYSITCNCGQCPY